MYEPKENFWCKTEIRKNYATVIHVCIKW